MVLKQLLAYTYPKLLNYDENEFRDIDIYMVNYLVTTIITKVEIFGSPIFQRKTNDRKLHFIEKSQH